MGDQDPRLGARGTPGTSGTSGSADPNSRVAAMLGQQSEGGQKTQWMPKSYPELPGETENVPWWKKNQGGEGVQGAKVCKSGKQL